MIRLIEGVIFDIDGTLVDHQLAIEKGIEEFYEEYFSDSDIGLGEFKEIWEEEHDKYIEQFLDGEVTFEEQRVLRVKGVFERAGKKEIDEKIAREYFDFYLDAYERGWGLFEDVIDCLDSLDGYRLAVLSNGDSSQQRQKLRDNDIVDYFEEVVISGDIGIAKPEKPVFDEIVEKLGVEYGECVYVGDSYDADFVGADNAGMIACL
ncbi:MAG: HAD family hydrolase, partial [Thermoplasmatota archaeon]